MEERMHANPRIFLQFYMFSIYDSYFAQYSSTCKEFQYIMNGNTELALVIKVAPDCIVSLPCGT